MHDCPFLRSHSVQPVSAHLPIVSLAFLLQLFHEHVFSDLYLQLFFFFFLSSSHVHIRLSGIRLSTLIRSLHSAQPNGLCILHVHMQCIMVHFCRPRFDLILFLFIEHLVPVRCLTCTCVQRSRSMLPDCACLCYIQSVV